MDLTARLKSVYSLLPQGCVMIDVGTDHCYLPIYAIRNDRCTKAYAADVRVGPLENGRRNAAIYGLEAKITPLLSDGLAALTTSQQSEIDTVVCAGMGGTLIQKIIEGAPFLKNPRYTLILQPQKAIYELKEYLAEHGFSIEKELLSAEGAKLYQCFSVRYTGQKHTAGNPFALMKSDPLFPRFFRNEQRRLLRQKTGLEQGGKDEKQRYETICRHLRELEEIKNESTTNL